MSEKLDQLCINTLRMLAVDQVEAANSGHPGLPLGAATPAYVLWARHLRHNPADPGWANRDRFILSAGHGSALIYGLLHLTGYDLSLDDLKNFRQWGAKTAGHPEYGLAPGVECTTGPLGQGFAMGVGMALAEAHLAANFNEPRLPVIDHYTYALVSDGDLMEGVASEAASIAGHLGLGKLIYIYDDNHISIEGHTDLTYTENVARRFESYNWQVLRVNDGNDVEAVDRAIQEAKAETTKPTLIITRTEIGFGSPRQDMAKAHGEPLGAENAEATRKALGLPEGKAFYIPEEVETRYRRALEDGRVRQESWLELIAEYGKNYPDKVAELNSFLTNELPRDWGADVPEFTAEDGPIATRAASGKVLGGLARRIRSMIGGSADLAPSNKTWIEGSEPLAPGKMAGRNIHFGVREHAMAAIVNGMALHGGVRPYAGTFLIFSDYMRPSIRLAALMDIPSIFVFTHDSIGVGEDGPTHQPIEQIGSLRMIPNLTVIRPADANESRAAWGAAIQSQGPVALAFTRQKLPVLTQENVVSGASKGAYVLADNPDAELLLVATGSEVHLALEAAAELNREGHPARVVSMPSWELFAAQDRAYQDQVLPPTMTKRLAIEAGVSYGWERYVGSEGAIIGLDRFGASAPGGTVFDKLGFNLANVVAKAKELL